MPIEPIEYQQGYHDGFCQGQEAVVKLMAKCKVNEAPIVELNCPYIKVNRLAVLEKVVKTALDCLRCGMTARAIEELEKAREEL